MSRDRGPEGPWDLAAIRQAVRHHYDTLLAASRLPWPARLDRIAALNGPQPSAPIDPYSGEPMRYRAQPSGYVIYSVGPDRKDDGGDTKTDVSVLIAPKTEPRR
jgi:hypothetical protein